MSNADFHLADLTSTDDIHQMSVAKDISKRKPPHCWRS